MTSQHTGYKTAADTVAMRFALGVANAEKDRPGARLEMSTWLAALDDAKKQGNEIFRDYRRSVQSGAIFEERQRQFQALRRDQRKAKTKPLLAKSAELRREVNAALQGLESKLKPIKGLPANEQKAELHTLFNSYVTHFTHLAIDGVPGSAIVAPDWDAVRGKLQTTSSEQSILKLETAFSHGRFAVTNGADYPMADISGRAGNDDVIAHAELRSDLDTPEARAIMRELAERLRDPRLAIGPRVQQTIQALMSFWITRKGADGAVVVTINQLAAALGYERGEHGFHTDVYQSIRGFVDAAARTNLRAMFPDSPQRPRIEEKAFTFTYYDTADGATHDRPSKGWLAIRFRPGDYFTKTTERVGALLKGYDRDLNRLHPVNERSELLLGKYLENEWRFNWNNEPGRVKRTVRVLLTAGIGMSEQTAMRPAMGTLALLSDALDALEQMRIVKHWEGDERWSAIYQRLEPSEGKQRRMNRSLWSSALDACITIEAGKDYHAHYRNHGLTYQPRSDSDAIHALRDYMARSDRPQAMIAAELGISPSMLSRLIAGKRAVSQEMSEKIDRLVNQGLTLALPLGDGGPR